MRIEPLVESHYIRLVKSSNWAKCPPRWKVALGRFEPILDAGKLGGLDHQFAIVKNHAFHLLGVGYQSKP